MSSLPNSRPGWWRRLTLRDVVFLTLPPVALVTWVFLASVADYHRIRRYDDWWSAATSVRKFGWHRLRAALNTLEASKIESRLSAEREDVPQLRLFVDRSEFDRVDRDVGAHWGEWIDAQIEDHGATIDAELRFRGDGSAHWGTEKKSFTLKTKRDELYKGFRTLAFSVKDVLPQYLAGSLAKDFGLLAPEQQIVPVFLNDRFYGLHRFVEPIDESFLRRNLRMPGNVFRADTAERGDYFKGLPREVFKNPYIWDRVANNDRPGAFGTQLLGEWLEDLNTSTFEEHQRFMAWHDVDELSRLLAYLLVVGDPYHMSGVHNQFWYEDPVSGTLHPIVWDVRLLDLEHPPRGSNINHFWRQALKDPRVWSGTMRELAKRLQDDSLLETAEKRLRFVAERYSDAIAFDQLRSGSVPPIGDVESALAILRKNVETLRGWVTDARASFVAVASKNATLWTIDVGVEGHAPVLLSGFKTIHDGPESPAFEDFVFDANENGVLGGQDERLLEWGMSMFRSLPLQPSTGGTGAELKPERRHARFFYKTIDTSVLVSAITLEFKNDLTWDPIIAGTMDAGTALPAGNTVFHQPVTAPAVAPVVLAGQRRLQQDLLVDEHGALTIEPGTTLTLEPDVSIECRGKLTALGTAESPITIQCSNPDLPWGVFALQGPGANGSRFEHVKFLGGGARQVGRVEYKGAVSVHYATGVVFDHCEFSHNQRCDDLINVVKSEASITNSRFHHSNADSIDYDMSGGLVAYNVIEGSGNDGLDLMTCWPRVIGNQILNSADKGLSIGEDSSPLVFANRIDGCERGIEVKDRSAPFVLHTTIENCKRGIYAHLKNWRYGEAGWPKLVGAIVRGNDTDYLAENGARITIDGSVLGELASDAASLQNHEWALRANGVVLANAQAGLATGYELTASLTPLFEGRFEADFVETRDGWTPTGDARRLFKRGHDLVVNLARGEGGFERAVDWDLSDASKRYVLVLEIAGEAVSDVRASVGSPSGVVDAPIALDTSPATYRFAAVELSPRRYDRLTLSAKPASTLAKLKLHTWRVFAWPSGGI